MTISSTVEYETTIFSLEEDSLGPNQATLLHARSTKDDGLFYKALLYIHGYSDYYFHDHLCVKFLEQGYDFFALDLRKCGRSIILPEQYQYRHYFTDIHEYDEEITFSVEHIIKQAGSKSKKLILYGHSTGGLIVSSYASSGPRYQDIDAVILNSPFLSSLETNWSEYILGNILMKFGFSVNVPDNWYARSIHLTHKGEWDFDAQKKTVTITRFHGPSCRAVCLAQQDLINQGWRINRPLLVLCSSRSIRPGKDWCDEYSEVDIVINVITMRRVASTMSPQVTIYEIENGIHDIFLSKFEVREKAFKLMFQWLKNLEETWLT